MPDGSPNRSSRVRRDLTKGSIPRNLWYMSWPQMTESFFSVVDQLADLFWAGRVGYKAIAGLGIASTPATNNDMSFENGYAASVGIAESIDALPGGRRLLCDNSALKLMRWNLY